MPTIAPAFPEAIETAFNIIEIPLTMRVKIHAHPLPLSRPHATNRFAIPIITRGIPMKGKNMSMPVPVTRKIIPFIINSIAIIVIPNGLPFSIVIPFS